MFGGLVGVKRVGEAGRLDPQLGGHGGVDGRRGVRSLHRYHREGAAPGALEPHLLAELLRRDGGLGGELALVEDQLGEAEEELLVHAIAEEVLQLLVDLAATHAMAAVDAGDDLLRPLADAGFVERDEARLHLAFFHRGADEITGKHRAPSAARWLRTPWCPRR